MHLLSSTVDGVGKSIACLFGVGVDVAGAASGSLRGVIATQQVVGKGIDVIPCIFASLLPTVSIPSTANKE